MERKHTVTAVALVLLLLIGVIAPGGGPGQPGGGVDGTSGDQPGDTHNSR